METEKIFLVLTIAATLLMLSGAATLAAPTNASVQVGTQERAPSQPAGNLQTEGGNVTEVNVSAYQVTTKWAGFYGTVSGDIRLADAANHIFYQWTVNDPTGGVVYATTGVITNWDSSNIAPLYASDGYLPTFLISGTDSFNNTFTQREEFSSPSLTISNVNYTVTNPTASSFKTYALRTSDGSVLIWAGKINAGQTTFNGKSGDYQILAGVMDQSNPTTYYFYLELP